MLLSRTFLAPRRATPAHSSLFLPPYADRLLLAQITYTQLYARSSPCITNIQRVSADQTRRSPFCLSFAFRFFFLRFDLALEIHPAFQSDQSSLLAVLLDESFSNVRTREVDEASRRSLGPKLATRLSSPFFSSEKYERHTRHCYRSSRVLRCRHSRYLSFAGQSHPISVEPKSRGRRRRAAQELEKRELEFPFGELTSTPSSPSSPKCLDLTETSVSLPLPLGNALEQKLTSNLLCLLLAIHSAYDTILILDFGSQVSQSSLSPLASSLGSALSSTRELSIYTCLYLSSFCVCFSTLT